MRTVFYIIITISILFGIAPALKAQEAGTVTVKLNTAKIKGKALNLDMDIKINHVYIGKRESLSLTLALKKGNEILYLPPVIINGSNKRKMYERAVNLYGLEAAKGGAYAVLKNDEDLIQFLPYQKSVEYKSWMNRSQLLLIGEVLDYNNNVINSYTDVLEKSLRIDNTSSRTKRQTSTATQTQSTTPAVQQNTGQPMDKVQQYLLQQQQKQQQPQQQSQQQQQQQQSPPPLMYRQGEYPSQQYFEQQQRQQQQRQPQQRR